MRRAATAAVLAFVAVAAVLSQFYGWRALWATPDQRGAWLMRQGRFADAADRFADPVWRGVALMQAGQFTDAEQSFSQADTPVAVYDRGNALLMLGKYPEAIGQYDAALQVRPGWPDALANRAQAQARVDKFAHLQGEQADQDQVAPDETYRQNRQRNNEPPPSGAQASVAMTDETIRALWLRRVQSRPADFLRARFAYQLEQAKQ
jgi:Ca-activated chloride channel family protein